MGKICVFNPPLLRIRCSGSCPSMTSGGAPSISHSNSESLLEVVWQRSSQSATYLTYLSTFLLTNMCSELYTSCALMTPGSTEWGFWVFDISRLGENFGLGFKAAQMKIMLGQWDFGPPGWAKSEICFFGRVAIKYSRCRFLGNAGGSRA